MRSYPGSQIVIEQTLDPGANYSRYIASYQSEGLKIYGLLTIPNGEKPATGWPAIVFNHGFIPPTVYRTTERYVAYVDAIARAGYIVFKVDYRGHGSSEGVARGAYSTPDYVVDVLNAYASMKQYASADPARIGMWGHSMGGYITLRAMVINKDIKAGVIWGGVVASYQDMFTLWHRPNSDVAAATALAATPGAVVGQGGASDLRGPRGWRNALTAQYGTPEQNPTFWNSISANSYLADLSGPLQLHHGLADTEVPPVFSETLYHELQAAGKTSEWYTYPGAEHNITEGFGLAMQRSIKWFDQYVKGK
jgi:dipeptidyl aminopeptidase/acylaminoacyl peptidase